MKKLIAILMGIVFLIIYIFALNLILEPVQKKLERTCALYDMGYHYRNNEQYCIEEDGIIHPIATDCPQPYQRGTCKIKFIK